ncbi:MAG: Do family serine endopeptidase [Pseudomonadota bacterium]
MRSVFAALFVFAFAAGASAQPNEGFADLAERLSPAVVNISTAQRVGEDDSLPTFPPGSPLERFNDLLGERPRIASSLGSGFIIDAAGIVVTNNHVIDEADEVEVVMFDGRTLAAEIIGRDPATDIAVLRVQPETDLPFVSFGDSDTARVGEWVVAIGNPFGLGGSLTAGVISAQGREIGGQYDDYIQTDVAINRGNSGGPLFDMNGDVIGVNTAIFSPTGASVGISFSVPSNIAAPVVDQLLEYGETRRGWLGVNVQRVDEAMASALGLDAPRGAVVTRITDGGPADEAGMEPGDLILAFNGEPVPDDRRLPFIVAETEVGVTAPVEILRRGEAMTLQVTVQLLEESGAEPRRPPSAGGEADEDAAPAVSSLLGLTLAPLTDALRREFRVHPDADGLVVTAVDPDSDAAGKVRAGDVVEQIAWTPVATIEEASAAVERAQDGERPVLLTLNRAGQFLQQALRP